MISFARAIGVVVLSAITATQQTIPGTYALLGKPAMTTAHMTVRWPSAGAARIAIQQERTGKVVRDYQIDMLHHMHLIVVRNDFQQFFHIHPIYDDATGIFTSTLPIDREHSYYVYADTWPTGVGQQVFRFPLVASAPEATQQPITTGASDLIQPAGPYAVRLGTTTLRANRTADITIDISLNGKRASDIHPYLREAGHAIFVNVQNLTYLHVHPTVHGHVMSAHQMLRVPGLASGTYKLWFQFRGGEKLYVAAYTIVVR